MTERNVLVDNIVRDHLAEGEGGFAHLFAGTMYDGDDKICAFPPASRLLGGQLCQSASVTTMLTHACSTIESHCCKTSAFHAAHDHGCYIYTLFEQ